jgi:hypothetical protein
VRQRLVRGCFWFALSILPGDDHDGDPVTGERYPIVLDHGPVLDVAEMVASLASLP